MFKDILMRRTMEIRMYNSSYDRIIIKDAGNQDRHKSSEDFDFGPLVSVAHLYVF